MALDKNDLLSLVATNLPDNTTGLITPSSVREVDEQIITANANLEELTNQTFKGPVTFDGPVSGSVLLDQVITRSITTQALPIHNGTEATEIVINFGSVESGDFSVVDGVVEALVAMTQVDVLIQIHLTKTGAQIAGFDCWLEESADGVVWTAIDETLRREIIEKDGDSDVIADFSFNSPLTVGDMFRIVATNSGANTLSMAKPSDIVTANGGANGASKILKLVKIR